MKPRLKLIFENMLVEMDNQKSKSIINLSYSLFFSSFKKLN